MIDPTHLGVRANQLIRQFRDRHVHAASIYRPSPKGKRGTTSLPAVWLFFFNETKSSQATRHICKLMGPVESSIYGDSTE